MSRAVWGRVGLLDLACLMFKADTSGEGWMDLFLLTNVVDLYQFLLHAIMMQVSVFFVLCRDAWHKLASVAEVDAMTDYVKLVRELDPKWQENEHSFTVGEGSREGGRGGGGGRGPVVSTLMKEQEEDIPEEDKSVFDWCKEGNVDRLSAMLSGSNIGSVDEEVRTGTTKNVLMVAN